MLKGQKMTPEQRERVRAGMTASWQRREKEGTAEVHKRTISEAVKAYHQQHGSGKCLTCCNRVAAREPA